MFIKACKDCPVYGFEFFSGKRTSKEIAAAADAAAGGSGAAATSTAAGAVPGSPKPAGAAATGAASSSASASGGGADPASKIEEVIVAVGHSGIALLPADDPLSVDLFPFERIGKWTVSRDGKIFAFSLEDARIIYVMTEVAGYMEKAGEWWSSLPLPVHHHMRAAGIGGDRAPCIYRACTPCRHHRSSSCCHHHDAAAVCPPASPCCRAVLCCLLLLQWSATWRSSSGTAPIGSRSSSGCHPAAPRAPACRASGRWSTASLAPSPPTR